MNLNDVKIPLSKRVEWMEENGGGITPFYTEIDMGDCMCKLCKDPKMEGQEYWRVPALVNDVMAYVCKNCYDLWVESSDDYWLTDNIKGIENPKIRLETDG